MLKMVIDLYLLIP